MCVGVYDLWQHAPVSKPILHSAAITSIVLNDTEGYFVTGYADGEIKVSQCYIGMVQPAIHLTYSGTCNTIAYVPAQISLVHSYS